MNLYENVIKPNNNFYLFITYDPNRENKDQKLPPSLLDKCFIINLKPLDNDENSSAQFIFGKLVNSER